MGGDGRQHPHENDDPAVVEFSLDHGVRLFMREVDEKKADRSIEGLRPSVFHIRPLLSSVYGT
jgi:hypothetical protein